MSDPILIYDGDCGFCRIQASRLNALCLQHLKLESFRDPGVIDRYPGLTLAQCEKAMQYVDVSGRRFPGAQAAAEAIRLNPRLAWTAHLYYIPGLRQIADFVYGWVARNRFRFSGRCDTGTCKIHPH